MLVEQVTAVIRNYITFGCQKIWVMVFRGMYFDKRVQQCRFSSVYNDGSDGVMDVESNNCRKILVM